MIDEPEKYYPQTDSLDTVIIIHEDPDDTTPRTDSTDIPPPFEAP
jgi:hypothetical protein